ncbi:zinc ribbon domain-containing protein [Acetobacterium bakii]|nr:zinc ribbon domain-containing protein [Acetobacterium bakii]
MSEKTMPKVVVNPWVKRTNCMVVKKNGEKSRDFCAVCYKNGEFTTEISLERMIEVSVPYLIKEKPGMKEEDARKEMEAFFPTLKRWRKN